MEFSEYVRDMDGRTGAVVTTFPEQGKFHVDWFDGSQSTESLADERQENDDRDWWWVRLLDRATATRCRDAVRAWTGDNAATLHEPGFHADGWTIALESGPEDWTIKISEPGVAQWPAGVAVEPLNHWALSVFVD
jgi:hypothetical protein